jgi:hypothetical protein
MRRENFIKVVKDPHEHDLDKVQKRYPVYDESVLEARIAVLKFMRRFAVQPIVSHGIDLATLQNINCDHCIILGEPPGLEHGVFFRFNHRPKRIACLIYEPGHWGDDKLDALRNQTNEYLLPFMFETRPSEMWWPKRNRDMSEPLQISIWAGRQAIDRAFNGRDTCYNPYWKKD